MEMEGESLTFCRLCGQSFEETAMFCPCCGARQSDTTADGVPVELDYHFMLHGKDAGAKKAYVDYHTAVDIGDGMCHIWIGTTSDAWQAVQDGTLEPKSAAEKRVSFSISEVKEVSYGNGFHFHGRAVLFIIVYLLAFIMGVLGKLEKNTQGIVIAVLCIFCEIMGAFTPLLRIHLQNGTKLRIPCNKQDLIAVQRLEQLLKRE